ncbi:MAG: tetratricopeptide repeat protein [Cyclobacteriaceae bacterium]|nr:tetratricopeptide repeat protein [Cyclobacteriaceae bacterium]
MTKNRIFLLVIGTVLIFVLFFLPRSVVRNTEKTLTDSVDVPSNPHITPAQLQNQLRILRTSWAAAASAEKSAIFADSLAELYSQAGRFDSAAWFAEQAASFFNTIEYWKKAGEAYYQAYTFSVDERKQSELAGKARQYLNKVLEKEPGNLDVKCQVAMTYLSSAPMQGVTMLREVLEADPRNQTALYNLGMLSVQSGQYQLAVERLEKLLEVNPTHTQGRLLLGVAYLNTGNKKKAREQFEFIKQADSDPAVQATVDSYLKDLK